jgi:hypothetical protein
MVIVITVQKNAPITSYSILSLGKQSIHDFGMYYTNNSYTSFTGATESVRIDGVKEKLQGQPRQDCAGVHTGC